MVDKEAEYKERIHSLRFSQRHERIIPNGPFRVEMGPTFEKYMMWGFVDDGVRFFASDSGKVCVARLLPSPFANLWKLLGLFEHVHQSQLSCALFAGSKTLITAGADSVISVWTVISTSKAVDLQPRGNLFGHRRTVNVLAVSKSFSALLSASADGKVILWDLNRLDLVRILTTGKPVEVDRQPSISSSSQS